MLPLNIVCVCAMEKFDLPLKAFAYIFMSHSVSPQFFIISSLCLGNNSERMNREEIFLGHFSLFDIFILFHRDLMQRSFYVGHHISFITILRGETIQCECK